ncbi:hypothetical protein RI129_011409 [Pyrocoelia pectoralis]|uniref:F-box domain-containing protein n=1 Tax=Pyrocoelia pectoralis TaxID=417401 RepID=A0AAN7ZIR2_9COLE
MTTVNDLPGELITEIVSYLPRQDRLTCSKVCTLWNNAVDSPMLWKFMLIYLDSDLMDPTTALLTKMYHKYLQTMELCWSNPYVPVRAIQHDLKEYSKRACQYIMLLQHFCVQLKAIKIIAWYDTPCIKKIIYHLCMFLRSQLHLVNVSFCNIHFCMTEWVKLMGCLNTFNSITHLDIIHCNHPDPLPFNSSWFNHLGSLQILKVDYIVLSGGLMDALLEQLNCSLRRVDIIVGERQYLRKFVPTESWRMLCAQCPMLRVGVHIKNRCHFNDISHIFCDVMPLTVFTLTCGKALDQTGDRQMKNTLSALIRTYHKILEKIYLQLNYNTEIIDEMLIAIIAKCPHLKYFEFHGNIESFDLLRDVCVIQTQRGENGMWQNSEHIPTFSIISLRRLSVLQCGREEYEL